MARHQSRHLTGTFGERIRQARLDLGLTQEGVARKLPVTVRTYQRWETSDSEPRGSQLIALSVLLGVEPASLHPPIEEAA